MEDTQKVSETDYQPVDGEPGTCPDCGEFIRFEGGDWMHEGGWVCNAQDADAAEAPVIAWDRRCARCRAGWHCGGEAIPCYCQCCQ